MAATTLVVGLDGSPAGERVLAFAKSRAKAGKECTLLMCYVVEWSPWTFQTPEENEERHARREEEIKLAHERNLDPAVRAARDEGLEVVDHVSHGDAADILNRLADEHHAEQIIIGRVGAYGLRERVFGGVSGRLVATASVPVTSVP